MSFRDCIRQAVDRGALKASKADEALTRYDEIVEELKIGGVSERQALKAGAEKVTLEIASQSGEAKKRAVRRIQKAIEIDKHFDTFKGKGKHALADAALALIERDARSEALDFSTLHLRRRGQFHAKLEQMISTYEPKVAGMVHKKAGLDNIVRELYGNDTGDRAAKEMSKAWGETTEFARKLHNRNGSLTELDDWRLPQNQSRVRMTTAGKTFSESKQIWVKDHIEWLNWNRMVEPGKKTKIPIDKREIYLGNVYDTIRTDGAIKYKQRNGGKGELGNRENLHRLLHFKDDKSWLSMQKKYMDGTIFDAMISHIDDMARRIALIDTFGPNPVAMAEWVKKRAVQRAAEIDVREDGIVKGPMRSQVIADKMRTFDEMFELATNVNAAASENRIASFGAGTRNILASAMLGSASLLAIPGDFMTTAVTKAFGKLPGTFSVKQYVKLMNPLSAADRKLAVRSGLIAENATSIAYSQARFTGDIMGPNITRKIADVTMRLSLLAPHTQAAKWAFGMEFMGALADNAGKSFKDVPFHKVMARYGIEAADWDLIRKTQIYKNKGATFLRPDDLMKMKGVDFDVALEVSDKFMGMILGEQKFAVPESSLRGRAFLVSKTQGGTLTGELLRSFAMFKNFPVTIAYTHMRRGLLEDSYVGRAAYYAALGAGMTVAGAMGVQARQIAKGRDPLDMTKPEFWGSAALAGGGMAIWGDFLFSDTNRFGGGLAMTASGPLIETLNSFRNLTIGNVQELLNNEDTNVLPELLRFARSVMPGSNIWYARLALQRWLWDSLAKATDPDAHRKMRRFERKVKRDFDQEFWWRGGENLPERAPEMGTAAGG